MLDVFHISLWHIFSILLVSFTRSLFIHFHDLESFHIIVSSVFDLATSIGLLRMNQAESTIKVFGFSLVPLICCVSTTQVLNKARLGSSNLVLVGF